MLDVARHFFDVDDVKRYIDLISLYKLNRLHLHLADDQGWRIEIKSWPNLTQDRRQHARWAAVPAAIYTQAQYSEIVAYARERFITIIPEIDMPGHTNAALASYAELNCDGKARPLYTGIEVGFSALCVDKDVTYTIHRRRRPRDRRVEPGAVLSHRRRRGQDAHARAIHAVRRSRSEDRPIAWQADGRLG